MHPADLPLSEELRAELGSVAKPRALESSPRSRVWRVELSGTPVVVKQLVDAPQADERYAREVAALRLASRATPPVVPRLLGADPTARVLVLEYLRHRHPGDDWVIDYAVALARTHATTGPADVGALPAWSGPTPGDVTRFLEFAAALGGAVPDRLRAELHDLLGRLDRTPGHALLHGDPCPGNDLHTADGVRFVDFEQASLGDPAVELAYLRIGFPTCWCVTAPAGPLLAEAEAAYRSAWRAATGAAAPPDPTDHCVGWLLRGDALVERARRDTVDHLGRLPVEDWTWGTASARQRLVHRLGVVAELAADRPGLTATGRLAADLRARMLARWPALGPVPARRPR
ncbi:aminoglycoside phosphotransferase [Wenjunlia vitaminophila]|uniref:Aminoglycoside phosphotransferase n=1 Tax=Wenjunlia vitaminophila TaxID=76728 RepID=A0A0T6LKY7_WENVI|nr:phosphotransferase [Wenjunlia vitaminophila]KRV46543.1 aminoglycoside phosphotransferase [Wenjunlia vitaminophila]